MSLHRTRLAVFLGALAFEVGFSVALCGRVGQELSELAVYFDGHLYMQIAKSFPLPFDATGPHYLGQAPGYPLSIALVELLTPSARVDWGMAALLATWLAAAGCATVFFELCRALGAPPVTGAVLFVVANPRWIGIATTAHPEPLALLLVLLCLLAWWHDRLPASVAMLSLAALTRFPAILLGLPLAIGFLLVRRQWRLRTFAWLAVPLLVLALYNVHLQLRIPGFESVWASHRVFWKPEFALPFTDLVQLARGPQRGPTLIYAMTYGTVAFYGVAIVAGLLERRRAHLVLTLWVVVTVLFHASLDSPRPVAALAFPRLAILAWPAALLLLWRPIGPRLGPAWRIALCAGFAATMIWPALWMGAAGVALMKPKPHIVQELQLLSVDEPLWYDFERRTRHVPEGTRVPWARPGAAR